MTDIQNVLKTYEAITLLVKVVRHNSTTFDAERKENVAEHSYSLAVLAGAIASEALVGHGDNKTIRSPRYP